MNQSIYPSIKEVVFSLVLSATVLVTWGVLRWLGVEAGDFVDWSIAVASFWWLLGIVTIPWNIYFGARETRTQLVESARREIEIDSTDIAYVKQAERRSLAIAVALHGISTLGFGALAYFGLTPIGWFAAAAALALTLFRPAVRFYRHVLTRLADINHRSRYPRDDIQRVLSMLEQHESSLQALQADLDPARKTSFAAETNREFESVKQRHEKLKAEHIALIDSNAAEHQRLEREAQAAAERLSEDAQFLGSVRDILRFVKEA